MRVFLRLDIAGERLASPGIFAFFLEGLVEADDVDDVEHEAGADEQLHVRHGFHVQELGDRHMVGADEDDAAEHVRRQSSQTLADGDDHGLAVCIALSHKHGDIQSGDEDVLLIGSIGTLMVFQFHGNEPDRLETEEQYKQYIRNEHLSAKARQGFVVFVTSVFEFQVKNDAVEEEPDGVHATLHHSLLCDAEEGSFMEKRFSHECEDEFPRPVEA